MIIYILYTDPKLESKALNHTTKHLKSYSEQWGNSVRHPTTDRGRSHSRFRRMLWSFTQCREQNSRRAVIEVTTRQTTSVMLRSHKDQKHTGLLASLPCLLSKHFAWCLHINWYVCVMSINVTTTVDIVQRCAKRTSSAHSSSNGCRGRPKQGNVSAFHLSLDVLSHREETYGLSTASTARQWTCSHCSCLFSLLELWPAEINPKFIWSFKLYKYLLRPVQARLLPFVDFRVFYKWTQIIEGLQMANADCDFFSMWATHQSICWIMASFICHK